MIKVLITANRACFVNQGEKTDCTTYKIPTPSSLIGLLGSIHGKPEFNWIIRRIKVVNPIKVVKMSTNGNGDAAFTTFNLGERGPVHRTYLKDVAYVVEAEAQIPYYVDNVMNAASGVYLQRKHEEILKRRIRRGEIGSCRGHLYLGHHECHCNVELIDKGDAEPESYYKGKETQHFYSIPFVQSFTPIKTAKDDVESVGKEVYGYKVKEHTNRIFRSPLYLYTDSNGNERKNIQKWFHSNFHYTDLHMKDGVIEINPSLYIKHTTNLYCNH